MGQIRHLRMRGIWFWFSQGNRRNNDISERALFLVFVAVIVLAPLPYGGNVPAAWMANAFVVGLLVLWYSADRLIQRLPAAVSFVRLWVPASLFLCVCLWAWIQSLSIIPNALHHPLWSAAGEALGEQVPSAISVNPYETRLSLMRLMTYGMVFWLALQLGRDQGRAYFLLHAIAIAIAAYATFGIINWSIGAESIFGYHTVTDDKALLSTFVGRNNFATLSGLGCLVLFALFMRSIRRRKQREQNRTFRRRISAFIEGAAGVTGLYFLGLVTVTSALLLTGSRAGFLATLFALLVFAGINLKRYRIGPLEMVFVIAGATGLFIVLFNSSGAFLSERLVQIDSNSFERVAVFKFVIDAATDFPIVGTGYGTFRDIFPMYRDETISTWGVWNEAHNTYLELIMELGMPAAIALFLAVGWFVWHCFRGSVWRQRNRVFPMIGFSASILVALHSLVDFSLQISGVAITYCALLGLGAAQSWSSRLRP